MVFQPVDLSKEQFLVFITKLQNVAVKKQSMVTIQPRDVESHAVPLSDLLEDSVIKREVLDSSTALISVVADLPWGEQGAGFSLNLVATGFRLRVISEGKEALSMLVMVTVDHKDFIKLFLA